MLACCGLWLVALGGCAGSFGGGEAFVERWQGAYTGDLTVQEDEAAVQTRGLLDIRPQEGHLRVECRAVEDVVAADFLVAFYRLRAENSLSGTYQGAAGRVDYDLRREGKALEGEIAVYDAGGEEPRVRLRLEDFRP